MPVPRKQRDPAPRHPSPPVTATLGRSMVRRLQIGIAIVISVSLAAGWNYSGTALSAQDQNFAAHDLLARGRVFPEIGAGVSVIKKDSAGRYYILAAPAKSIAIYQADGKRVGQIPNQNSHGATIAYAQDFDIDASGRILIADRGANSVKIFAPDGSLETSFAFPMPLSVIALPAADCEPPADRKHWTKITIEQGATPPSTKAAIQALATDPESDEVWVAIFDELVHIDQDGNRRAAYRTSTQEGARIEPRAMLVEHNRILIADEELGIFDFPLPERLPGSAPRP